MSSPTSADDILALVGEHTPLALFIVSTLRLIMFHANRVMAPYYVVGSSVNIAVNCILKALIKSPRPSPKNKNSPKPAHTSYGMPSGHVQAISFTTVFLSLADSDAAKSCSMLWPLLYSTLVGITAWQRVAYNHHTVSQAVAGIIVGALMGRIIYAIIQNPQFK